MIPPMIWLWPLIYFVVLCMTISAPNSNGRRKTGVANVDISAIVIVKNHLFIEDGLVK